MQKLSTKHAVSEHKDDVTVRKQKWLMDCITLGLSNHSRCTPDAFLRENVDLKAPHTLETRMPSIIIHCPGSHLKAKFIGRRFSAVFQISSGSFLPHTQAHRLAAGELGDYSRLVMRQHAARHCAAEAAKKITKATAFVY